MKEGMKRFQRHIGGDERLTVPQTLISGGVAGMVSTTITIPIDVVKTKLQTQTLVPSQDGKMYRGVWHALWDIGKNQGIKGQLFLLFNSIT